MECQTGDRLEIKQEQMVRCWRPSGESPPPLLVEVPPLPLAGPQPHSFSVFFCKPVRSLHSGTEATYAALMVRVSVAAS